MSLTGFSRMGGLLCAAWLAGCAMDPPLPWMTVLELAQAREKAIAENRRVLMLFTGSDWCPPCQLLQRRVLQTPEFRRYAQSNLVLVEVDFPRRKLLAPELSATNHALARNYQVEVFPTLVLLDREGKELRKAQGYLGGGWERHLAWIEPRPEPPVSLSP